MTDPSADPWQVFVAGAPAGRPPVSAVARTLLHRSRIPALVATSLLFLGAPMGILWAKVSPRIAVSFSAQGPALDHPESSEFFATDASFMIVLVVAGLLTGAAVWRFTRRRGAGVPVGIAVGGLLAGIVARVVGGRVVVDPDLARVCRAAACDVYDGTLEVRSTGLVVLFAVAALAALIALTAVLDGDEVPPPYGPWPPPLAHDAWAPPQSSGVS